MTTNQFHILLGVEGGALLGDRGRGKGGGRGGQGSEDGELHHGWQLLCGLVVWESNAGRPLGTAKVEG